MTVARYNRTKAKDLRAVNLTVDTAATIPTLTVGTAATLPVGTTIGSSTPLAGSSADRIEKVAVVTLAALDTGGGVLSWQNPESTSIIVSRIFFDVTTIATGSCTIDVGTTAASATTSSDNLMDGLDAHSATGLFGNLSNPGTNGKTAQKLASGKWVTASMASGAAAGLAGKAYIHYALI